MEDVDNFLKAVLPNNEKNRLSIEERDEVIKERYKFIKQEKKKRGLKDLKLDRLTKDRLKRKIYKMSDTELAIAGFNALVDEACGVNNKKE